MVDLADGTRSQDHNQLLQAQAHIWNHIFNFINSMSLKCAIQLGIPDAINKHGKPMTLSDLIIALSIHPAKTHAIPRLVRILVHSGFLDKEKTEENSQETEGYVLTNASKLLVKEHPFSLKTFLLAMLDPVLTGPWDHLTTWFLNDDPTPFQTCHGRGIWKYAGHNPELNSSFNEAMACDAKMVASILIKECEGVFDGLKSLVDVGGGTGTVAKALADSFPQLDCCVFDLPHVVAGLQDGDNLKFVGGDMFEEIPPADAILLKWIMHDWHDEKCIKILKNCKEAIKGRKGGKLIIIDMVMETQKEDKDATETELFLDMLMIVLYNGKERNKKEWAKLFFDAGFSDFKITPVLGLRSVVEVYP
ncbi:trans-resveratrol di-O-methyltransferase [Jatropha curcas]|uniref:trans-resveratrol di-O-methyltransferase n=1 Tax=Jatropha curcas TaxID=180498 RepID=UPI0005FB45FF|nr:trans-resveratrol di-O-methyltransferase [Jatropha curcas]